MHQLQSKLQTPLVVACNCLVLSWGLEHQAVFLSVQAPSQLPHAYPTEEGSFHALTTPPAVDCYCLMLKARLGEGGSLSSWFGLSLRQALCSWNLGWRVFSISAFLTMATKLCIASVVHLGQEFPALLYGSRLVLGLTMRSRAQATWLSHGDKGFSSTLFLVTVVLSTCEWQCLPPLLGGLRPFIHRWEETRNREALSFSAEGTDHLCMPVPQGEVQFSVLPSWAPSKGR